MDQAQDLGQWLRLALGNRSIMWLAEELERTGVEGSGYSSVYRYVRGQVEPPVSWLREAARVLDVRLAFLVAGPAGGSMTEAGESARRVPHQVDATKSAALSAFFQAADAVRPIGVGHVDQMALTCISPVALWIGPHGLGLPGLESPPGEQKEHQQYVEAARMLGRALVAPLEALRLDPSTWPETTKAQYVSTLMASLVPLVDLSFAQRVQERNSTPQGEEVS